MFPYFYFFVEIKTLTATNRLTNCWCIFGITRPSFNFAHCRKISKKRDRSAVNYTLLNKTMIFFFVLPCTICNKTVAKAVEWCKKNRTFLGRRSFQKNKGRRTFFFLTFFFPRESLSAATKTAASVAALAAAAVAPLAPKIANCQMMLPKNIVFGRKKIFISNFFSGPSPRWRRFRETRARWKMRVVSKWWWSYYYIFLKREWKKNFLKLL